MFSKFDIKSISPVAGWGDLEDLYHHAGQKIPAASMEFLGYVLNS
jgi:hypothetical protein